jgi:hypothetical protein
MRVLQVRGQTKDPAGLISVLLDSTAEFGDRDDAAMDLSRFDDPEAEAALAHVACDPGADNELADSCGESLAEVWCRRGRIEPTIVLALTPAAWTIALATLRTCSPRLASEAEEFRVQASGKTSGK